MTDLVIIALATWYVAYAVTSTHGPGGVFEWVREHVWHGRHGKGYVVSTLNTITHESQVTQEIPPPKNGLLDCPVCLAFWAALILLIAPMGIVTQALAVAGAAMLMHGIAGWRYAHD